jgi:hypothetical protein
MIGRGVSDASITDQNGNLLNIRAIVDDIKCFETVRGLRWPDGVRCAHCELASVIKHGRDDTQASPQQIRGR